MTKLWGIPNCDTVKKARRWLDNQHIDYQFCDFRERGLNAKQISNWINTIGLENLVNKRSTTWKNLSDKDKAALSAKTAVPLILEHPTLIKRPLLETIDSTRTKVCRVGFSEGEYRAIFT